MTQTQQVKGVATSVRTEDGVTIVRYHQTDVVKFDTHHVTLNSGGYRTATTKVRMMQASNQFDLGFAVYQKAFDWFVVFADRDKVDG